MAAFSDQLFGLKAREVHNLVTLVAQRNQLIDLERTSGTSVFESRHTAIK